MTTTEPPLKTAGDLANLESHICRVIEKMNNLQSNIQSIHDNLLTSDAKDIKSTATDEQARAHENKIQELDVRLDRVDELIVNIENHIEQLCKIVS